MDRPRANPRKKRGPLYAGAAVLGVALVSVALIQLQPAAPSVDRAAMWTDSVRRGPLIVQVGGNGTLVPENIRYIPAVTAGRVEAVHVRPGSEVEAGTLLLELSNPELEIQLMEAERQLSEAQSNLLNLEANLETQRLNQESTLANMRSQFNEAERTARTNEELASRGLVSANEVSRARDQLEEYRQRLGIEQQRLEVMRSGAQAQLSSQRGHVQRLQSMVAYRRGQLDGMNVRAGGSGVLQQLDLQVGQWVNPGTTLAIVVQPRAGLRAVLRIPETQARDVVVGLRATVDTRNGIVQGRVVRVDPSAQGGTVGVDVALEGELPPGARPDLSVDGRIIIDELNDVLFVGRPPFGGQNSTVGLFRLTPDGRHAERVTVQFGRASVNHIQVVQGLAAGDVVILADMSQFDSSDRVRLQ
jgi:HlyD family secretion protein